MSPPQPWWGGGVGFGRQGAAPPSRRRMSSGLGGAANGVFGGSGIFGVFLGCCSRCGTTGGPIEDAQWVCPIKEQCRPETTRQEVTAAALVSAGDVARATINGNANAGDQGCSVGDAATHRQLQQLIWDFAREASEEGIVVEASVELGRVLGQDFVLHLDRDLSTMLLRPTPMEAHGTPPVVERLEPAPAATAPRELEVPLCEVSSVRKATMPRGDLPAVVLSACRHGEVVLVFRSEVARDRAYTGLRVFHLSAENAA